MLRMNCINAAHSGWASLIVFAPEKDRSLQICVNYRKLNAVTVKDASPIPGWTNASTHLAQLEYSRQSMPIQATEISISMSATASNPRLHLIMDCIALFVCCLASRTHQARSSVQWTWFIRQSSGNSLQSIFTISLYSPSPSWITSLTSAQLSAYCSMPACRWSCINSSSSTIKWSTCVAS